MACSCLFYPFGVCQRAHKEQHVTLVYRLSPALPLCLNRIHFSRNKLLYSGNPKTYEADGRRTVPTEKDLQAKRNGKNVAPHRLEHERLFFSMQRLVKDAQHKLSEACATFPSHRKRLTCSLQFLQREANRTFANAGAQRKLNCWIVPVRPHTFLRLKYTIPNTN